MWRLPNDTDTSLSLSPLQRDISNISFLHVFLILPKISIHLIQTREERMSVSGRDALLLVLRIFHSPRGEKILSLRTLDWIKKHTQSNNDPRTIIYNIYLIEPAIWYI